jgi:GNAT superfamily N-acetyltransferase
MEDRLRKAEAADVPRLEELIAFSARELSRGFYTDEQIEAAVTHLFGVDTQLVEDGTYYLIERGGRPVACGGWSRRRALYGANKAKAGAETLLDPASESARLRAFFVDPRAARQGLGRRLAEECAFAAKAAGFSSLELAATLPGVPLYEACGFTAADRFDIALPGGVGLPLVLMRRQL